MEVLRIAVIAVSAILLGALLKNIQSPLAIIVSLAVSVVILFYLISKLMEVLSQINYLKSYVSISGKYIELLLKVIGITYITQLTADLCKDNGYSAVAGQIETFSKLTIAAMSMPVVIALFEAVTKCTG